MDSNHRNLPIAASREWMNGACYLLLLSCRVKNDTRHDILIPSKVATSKVQTTANIIRLVSIILRTFGPVKE